MVFNEECLFLTYLIYWCDEMMDFDWVCDALMELASPAQSGGFSVHVQA